MVCPSSLFRYLPGWLLSEPPQKPLHPRSQGFTIWRVLAERGGSPALASPLVVYYKITKIAALWRGDSLPLTHHGLPPFPWVFSSGGFSQNPTETRPMAGKFQESSKKSCTDKAHFGKPPGLAPPICLETRHTRRYQTPTQNSCCRLCRPRPARRAAQSTPLSARLSPK